MSKRKIKSTIELPAWFGIEKYEFCSQLSNQSWAKQLRRRRSTLHSINSDLADSRTYDQFITDLKISPELPSTSALSDPNSYPFPPNTTEEQCEAKKELSDGQKKQLVANAEEKIAHYFNMDIEVFREGLCKTQEPPKYITTTSVQSTCLGDAIACCDDETKLGDIGHWYTDLNTLHDSLYPDNSHLHVTIDLTVSDDRLIEDLLRVARAARKARATTRSETNPTDDNVRKLVKYKCLAYLDLLIWAKHNNLSIPQRVVACALFPNGEKGPDEVRKAIKSWSYLAISTNFLRSLS
jgi:hypothetical protein